jgi:hypothetical protein
LPKKKNRFDVALFFFFFPTVFIFNDHFFSPSVGGVCGSREKFFSLETHKRDKRRGDQSRKNKMSDIKKKHEDGAVYFFAKKDAQDAMLAHQDEQGHQFAVCRIDKMGHAYASYSDAETFAKIYTTEIPENQRFHNELIRAGKPVRFCLDIEFVLAQQCDHEAQRRLDKALQLATTLLNRLPGLSHVLADTDYVVYQSSRADKWGFKHSFHVVLPHVYFENMSQALKSFMAAYKRQSPKPAEEPLLFWYDHEKKMTKHVVDSIIYSKNRVFRLPLSAKYSTDASSTESKAVPFTFHSGPPGTQLLDAFVTVPPSASAVVITQSMIDATFDEPINGRKRKNNTDDKTDRKSKRERPSTSVGDEHMALLQAMLRTHGDCNSLVRPALPRDNAYPGTTVYPCSNGGTARRCLLSGRDKLTHESNKSYLVVHQATGRVDYHCHSQACKDKSKLLDYLPLPAAAPNDIDRSDPSDVVEYSDFDIDRSGLHAVVEYSEEFVRPFDCSSKVLLVKSGMGTGKTTALVDTLKQMLPVTVPLAEARPMQQQKTKRKTQVPEGSAEPKCWQEYTATSVQPRYKRILVISTRVAFAKTMLGSLSKLGFELYTEVSDQRQLASCDRLIIQYESLHKLIATGSLQMYDCLVLDEVESLLNNTTGPMNKEFIHDNEKVFEDLVTHSGRILALDADLSNKTVQFFKELVQPENVTLNINSHHTMKRSLLVYLQKEGKDAWLANIRKDVLDGKRLMIPVTSKQVANELIIPFLQANLDSEKYRLYTADTDDAQLSDFEDIEAAWGKLQVVVFTPCVTVGADFSTRDHFDCIYAYGTSLSCVPRTLLQMCGRCRHPRNATIHMCVMGKQGQNMPMLADVQQTVTEHMDVVRTFEPATSTMNYKRMPTWLHLVHCFNELERRRAQENYLSELLRLAASKGYACSVHDEQVPVESPDVDLGTPPDEAANFDATSLIDAEEAETLEQKVQRKSASAEEKQQLRVFHYKRRFTEPVDGAHYVAVEPHVNTLRNIWLSHLTPEQVREHDSNKVDRHFAETVSLASAKLDAVKRISNALGLGNLFDTKTDISRARIEGARPLLQEMLPCLKTQFQLRNPKLETFRQILGVISAVFQHWHGGELKRVKCTRPGAGESESREREQVYRLGFSSVLGDKTLLDIAKTSKDWQSTPGLTLL